MKQILYLLLLLYFEQAQIAQNNPPAWCWTKPAKSQDGLDLSKGGLNWALCRSDPHLNAKIGEKVPYEITVQTLNVKNMGTDGKIFCQLFGSRKNSQEFVLSETGFKEGSTRKVKVFLENIGDLQRVALRTTSEKKYRCNKIRVKLGAKFWDVDCDDAIYCPYKCQSKMEISGNQRYLVTVKTASEPNSDTKFPIYIKFYGTLGRTPFKLLTDQGFNLGESRTMTINSIDVGTVYGVEFEMDEGSWQPTHILVKRGGVEESDFDPKDQRINCPTKSSLKVMNEQPEDKQGKNSKKNQLENSEKGGGESEQLEDLDSDFLGGAMKQSERSQIIHLGCGDKLKSNELFQTKFPGQKVNFHQYYAICPANCDKEGDGLVYGKEIHPEESLVCRAALVDNSMPLTGGLIGIGLQSGLEFYQSDERDPPYKIAVNQHKESQKSFYTFKIDNIDMSESDLRIINSQGKPSFEGRVEVRVDGIWGSLCDEKANEKLGRVICRQLKYEDGWIKNPQNSSDFCRNFQGENYCAPDQQKIHYSKINCQGDEQDIKECYHETPENSCSHNNDLIVECQNKNYDYTQKPRKGTTRILDTKKQFSAKGRLEFYDGSWGSVCNSKFNEINAKVACKAMGFNNGKLVGSVGENGVCSKEEGLCGEGKIAASDVQCTGSEDSFKQCGMKLHPQECTHEQDVIIDCEGTEGDPSGKSQEVQKEAIGAPKLGKLSIMPIKELACETTLEDKDFRGDPGSVYVAKCPANCLEQSGTIWGSFIYTSDSSICRAAIHAGVIKNKGGLLEVIKKKGLQKYYSSLNRNIQSNEQTQWELSFAVSQVNSLHIRLSESFQEKFNRLPSSFLQIDAKYRNKHINLNTVELKNRLLGTRKLDYMSSQTRFQQKDLNPLYQWVPPSPGFSFDGEKPIISTQGQPGADKTNQLTEMTILLSFKLAYHNGHPQTLVAHSGCGGYVLMIDQNAQLAFKQRCTQNEALSFYSIPLKEQIIVGLTYDGKTVVFYVNGQEEASLKKTFQFTCDKTLDIGSFSETKEEVFIGEINWVQIYSEVLSQEQIQQAGNRAPFIVAQGQTSEDSVHYTVDNRLCVSQCTTNPLPGQKGAPDPPKCSNLGQPEDCKEDNFVESEKSKEQADGQNENKPKEDSSEGISIQPQRDSSSQSSTLDSEQSSPQSISSQDGPLSSIQSSSSSSSSLTKPTKNSQIPLSLNNQEETQEPSQKEISCLTLGSEFPGPSGKTFRIQCPKNCEQEQKGNVFGTQIYSEDSSICKAAIHSGQLDEKSHQVMMVIANGIDLYISSEQNGITSAQRAANVRSFIF